LDGLTGSVVSLYAKGMTTGDIHAHLGEIYGTEISRDTISRITHAVVEDLLWWQNRPLDRVYPVLLIDAIVVKVRDGQVANQPFYVAMGINLEGERAVAVVCGLYATKRGWRPLIRATGGVCHSTPQWSSSRRR
jgi:putative transposase